MRRELCKAAGVNVYGRKNAGAVAKAQQPQNWFQVTSAGIMPTLQATVPASLFMQILSKKRPNRPSFAKTAEQSRRF